MDRVVGSNGIAQSQTDGPDLWMKNALLSTFSSSIHVCDARIIFSTYLEVKKKMEDGNS